MRADGINICFSTAHGWFSWLLRSVMRAPISHCLVTFRSETLGKVLALEVQGRGFVAIPWKRWRKHNTLVARYSLALPEAQISEALGKLAERLGDPYDTWSLIGYLLRRFTSKRRNPLDSESKVVCSEVVALFLGWAGVEGVGHAGSVDPMDLLGLALRNPAVFRLEWAGPELERARRRLGA